MILSVLNIVDASQRSIPYLFTEYGLPIILDVHIVRRGRYSKGKILSEEYHRNDASANLEEALDSCVFPASTQSAKQLPSASQDVVDTALLPHDSQGRPSSSSIVASGGADGAIGNDVHKVVAADMELAPMFKTASEQIRDIIVRECAETGFADVRHLKMKFVRRGFSGVTNYGHYSPLGRH